MIEKFGQSIPAQAIAAETQFIEFAASLCYDEYNKKEKRLDRIFLFHEER